MSQFHFRELIVDPDFSRVYEIHEKSFTWDGPRADIVTNTTNLRGIAEQAKEELLEDLGFSIDDGSLLFYTSKKLTTATDGIDAGINDVGEVASEIVFEGVLYRFIKVKDYSRYGFYIYQCQRDRGL